MPWTVISKFVSGLLGESLSGRGGGILSSSSPWARCIRLLALVSALRRVVRYVDTRGSNRCFLGSGTVVLALASVGSRSQSTRPQPI
jgi:hypothetical protein